MSRKAELAQATAAAAVMWLLGVCVSGIPHAGRRQDAQCRRAWRQRRDASHCSIRSYVVGDTAIVVSTPSPLSPTHVSEVSTAHLRLHLKYGDAGLEFHGRSIRAFAYALRRGHCVREGRSSAKAAGATIASCACAHQRLEHSLEHCSRKCSRNGVSSTICSRAPTAPPDASEPCSESDKGLFTSILTREYGTRFTGYGSENARGSPKRVSGTRAISRAFRGLPDGSKPCSESDKSLFTSILKRDIETCPADSGKENT
jgi:hypothetical protein